MTHITPKDPDSIPELAPVLKMVEAAMGFVPTSMLTMAHWPELMTSFSAFAGPVLNSGSIDPGLSVLSGTYIPQRTKPRCQPRKDSSGI